MAVGKLAARVAHEINNPLAGIQNSFMLIKDAIPTDHIRYPYVARIEREIDRIARIVRQMVDLYRPEPQVAVELFLQDTINEAVVHLRPNAEAKGVQISVVKPRQKTRIFIQNTWLRQVLLSLVQNAIDAAPSAYGQVELHTKVNVHNITIMIEDNGGGIDQELLPHLFEPFFTTKHATDHSGAGLGLSVSKNLVNAMGGRIEVESKPGVGSKFHLILPYPSIYG